MHCLWIYLVVFDRYRAYRLLFYWLTYRPSVGMEAGVARPHYALLSHLIHVYSYPNWMKVSLEILGNAVLPFPTINPVHFPVERCLAQQ